MSEQWFLVDDLTGMDAVTGSGIPTPLDVEPTPEAGQAVVRVCGGWPDKMYYVPGDKGFDNIAAAPLISALQFKLLLTQAERIAIRAAGASDTSIADYLDLIDTNSAGIDLTHPIVVAGVQHLVTAALITTDRATQILSGQPPA